MLASVGWIAVSERSLHEYKGAMSITSELYRTRPIRFLELWEEGGWGVKIYGISSLAERPQARLLTVAKEIAKGTLPSPALNAAHYGAAFVTIHEAEMFNQIIVDWWERVNELRHRVFKAQPAQPFSFEEITASGEAFCIWELRVISFEREAWLNLVLKNRNETGIDDYLSLRLNEDA